MKFIVMVALLGVCLSMTLSCPLVPVHNCVKVKENVSCKAIEVCEKPVKEPCGACECEYPNVCASVTKPECQKFLELQKICQVPKKHCTEVVSKCGPIECRGNSECIKKVVCETFLMPIHPGRKLNQAVANSNAVAVAEGGDAVANANAIALAEGKSPAAATANAEALAMGGSAKANSNAVAISQGGLAISQADSMALSKEAENCPTCAAAKLAMFETGCHSGNCGEGHSILIGYKEETKCHEVYECVPKLPCQPVIVKKCVDAILNESVDLCPGGFPFKFSTVVKDICGEEVCGLGYKCADVLVQSCESPCDEQKCQPGFECTCADVPAECKDFEFLASICTVTNEPVCIPLPAHLCAEHKPSCKTVMQCEVQESCCGNIYCPAGYICSVEMKPSCETAVPEGEPIPPASVAISSSSSKATEEGAFTQSDTFAAGDAAAMGNAIAATPKAQSLSGSLSDGFNNIAESQTQTQAVEGSKAGAGANAETSG